ncbi:MAG: aspartate aminotransferase family protein [Candidatus Omnitrophica bacterium]|nr:aspartate aminotransferase family protein [Candidatus Omnitrophota bacterium]
MRKEDIFSAYKDYIMPTYSKTPLIFVKGKGSRLWDIHHRCYLDFFPGWGVGNLGHCHPKIMAAARDQISKLIFVPNNYYQIPQAKLAREIIYWSYPGKVFFCNSGAEANEAAIKFSRKFGRGRYEIIVFVNSFHGRTLATLAATGQEKYREGFAPLPEGFKIVSFNDLQAVKDAITDKTVAIMLELIQGEGGVNVAERDFVQGLRKLCDEMNLLLIVDEVQTGIGRTGKLFCYQHYGITPDIMTLAKAIAGGFPLGVMVVRKEFADILGPGMHASTFGGGPVICKVALAVFKTIQQEKLLTHCQRMGEYLFKHLNILRKKYAMIKDVRGMGLMAGIELDREAKTIVQKCFDKGLLINCTHDRVLRLMPALNITKQEIDKAIEILDEVLRDST